jgi:hypothetical protein
MSQQNFVAVNIAEAELTEIKTAIETLRTKLLPHLKAVNGSEKLDLPKMGDKTVSFVQKALEHCNQNPELVPQFMDVGEFSRDVVAVEKLRSFNAPLTQIVDLLDDTITLAGSDAYAAALMFYNTVKTAKKANVAKAGTIYEDLSARFSGRGGKAVIDGAALKG